MAELWPQTVGQRVQEVSRGFSELEHNPWDGWPSGWITWITPATGCVCRNFGCGWSGGNGYVRATRPTDPGNVGRSSPVSYGRLASGNGTALKHAIEVGALSSTSISEASWGRSRKDSRWFIVEQLREPEVLQTDFPTASTERGNSER